MKQTLTIILGIIIVLMATVESYSAWKRNTNMPADYVAKTYLDVFFLPDNPQYGWICGFEGRILRTTNGGQSWIGLRIVPSPGENIQLESIHFINEKVGFTSGPELSALDNMRSYLFRTNDGGETWVNITPRGATNLWGNYFIDENIGFVVGGGCEDPQMFWKTTDGGVNWTFSRYFELESKMSDVIVYPDGTGYGAGSGALWFTLDMGSTWAILSRTGNFDWHEEITHFGQTHFLPYSGGCTGTNDANYGGVAFSNDGGQSWQRYSTESPMYGTFLHDELRGWGAGFNRAVIYTDDGGKNWVYDNCGIPAGVNLDDIWFIDDTTGWVVGDGIYEYFVPIFPKPEISALSDTMICEGEEVTLTLNEEYEIIQWSNGARSRSITVTEPGNYFATVYIDSICFRGVSNTISVTIHPKQEIGLTIEDDKIPCDGDSVVISIANYFIGNRWSDGSTSSKLTVKNTGYFHVEVVDSNGCVYGDSIFIQFNPSPEPTVNLSRLRNVCVGDTVTLIASDGFVDYFWFKDDDSDYFSRDKSVIVSEDGVYYVVVVNEFGCTGLSDKIQVIFKDETDALSFSFELSEEFEIDTTAFRSLRCGNMQITNKTDKQILINDLYLFRNIAFTTPLKQFPLVIDANSSVQVKICFSPTELGLERDTILIEDNCTDRIIKLVSYGSLSGAVGDSRCDVPLYFTPREIGGRYLYISDSYPNPASNMITLDYQYDDEPNASGSMSAVILDIYGNELITGHFDVEFAVSDAIGHFSLGKIKFDVSSLNTGFYFTKIQTHSHVEIRKIIISK